MSMEGQIDIFRYLLGLEADEEISPAQEYYLETRKTTYWQDSQGKPYRWWKKRQTESEDKE